MRIYKVSFYLAGFTSALVQAKTLRQAAIKAEVVMMDRAKEKTPEAAATLAFTALEDLGPVEK